MLIHPQFNPVALSLGPLSVHWYAVMYLIGFALFIVLGRWRIRRGLSVWNKDQLDDCLTYGILGVILGGRLGYVLFYQPAYFFAHPADILKIWQGGMAFHGGLIGAIIAMLLFAARHKLRFWQIADMVAPLTPLGLGAGRIGNFINGELWGRVTDPAAWWAMGFPAAKAADDALAASGSLSAEVMAAYAQYGVLPRHASQLYEFFLEGLLLFAVVWWFARKPRAAGQISAVFLTGYGIFRFIVEYTRQPDDHLGLLALGWSMGQWLCVPMIIGGIVLFAWAARHKTA